MRRKRKQTTPSPLRDGLLKVYAVKDVSEPGEMPEQGLELKYELKYDERMVGLNRFWTAMQHSARISFVVRCHRIDDVTNHDVVVLRDGKQYDIAQIQHPPDIWPKVMDLSLVRRADAYDIAEVPT